MQASPTGPSPRDSLVSDPVRWDQAEAVIREIVQYQPPRQPVPTEPPGIAEGIWRRWQRACAGVRSTAPHFAPAREQAQAVTYMDKRVLEEDTSAGQRGLLGRTRSLPAAGRSGPAGGSRPAPALPPPPPGYGARAAAARGGAGRPPAPQLSRSASMPQPRHAHAGRQAGWRDHHPEPPPAYAQQRAWEPPEAVEDTEAPVYDYARDGSPPPDADPAGGIDPTRLSPVSLRMYQVRPLPLPAGPLHPSSHRVPALWNPHLLCGVCLSILAGKLRTRKLVGLTLLRCGR